MKGNWDCHRYTDKGKKNHDLIFNTCDKCGREGCVIKDHKTCNLFKRKK